jgi:aspartokinase
LKGFVPPDSENMHVLEEMGSKLQGGTLSVERGLAAVTMVGTGLLDTPRIVEAASEVLAGSPAIPVQAFVSTTIAVTFYVPEESYVEALRRLHAAFVESGRE